MAESSDDWTHMRAKHGYHYLNRVLDGCYAVKRWKSKLRRNLSPSRRFSERGCGGAGPTSPVCTDSDLKG